MAAGVAFALLLLAYAQLGFLVTTLLSPTLTEGLLVVLLPLVPHRGMT